ncbi:hypothetical protein B0F90DRAFT_1626162 [Multifurca ochricompacta]|uniref:Uncharacterized protein n=1 Tax=Multifurca ochricompacta TaxID=376703 RepID=A0AAD4QQ12_9AGAM|nr:hypothetical protein B0F90DRAFT_1626162 [Multifurca ochricompacta]
MLNKASVTLTLLSLLFLSDLALGRMRWAERDGRPVFLHPRRFGQEHPPVIDKIASACPGAVCGTLAGGAIAPLLAAQPECSQQDFADTIVNASRKFDAATQANMIALAQEYRQAEKNTPPDFTTNPPTNRNSVFCQKAPANPELSGLVQAQDTANNPNVFFDPALGKSILRGSQTNTEPFRGPPAATLSSGNSTPASPASRTVLGTGSLTRQSSAPNCTSIFTVTTTVTVTSTPAPAGSTHASAGPTPVLNVGNFGSCSIPQIEFGVGFDNRKETSFEPVDKKSYNHGSAQNVDIISKFICDALVNSCGADQTARSTCVSAQAAAEQKTAKTGAQADAFNAVFGIRTNFTTITPFDDQGRPVDIGAAPSPTASSVSSVPSSSPVSSSPASGASSAADFGKCSTPEIKFAVGLDGRKETAFAPMDQISYNHGSADNIGVITQFMCDALTNTCAASQAAKTLCAMAQAAANAATPLTGAQADAFNVVFGQTTNFASVTPIDNTGKPVMGASLANPTKNPVTPVAVTH